MLVIKYRGAMVRKVYPGGNQSIPTGSQTMLTWSVVDYDTDGFFNPEYPTRLTIPANVSKVRVQAQNIWAGLPHGGLRQLVIKKNGQFFPGDPCTTYLANDVTTTDILGVSPVLPVVKGDYFENEVFHTSGAVQEVFASTGTYFSIEVVE